MRSILFVLWVVALVVDSPALAAQPPNIILIMADDLGYETLGCNGSTSYRTPHLDQLAASGVRFTQCHVQPLCTPTRVQIMTGMSNARNYIDFGNMDRKAVTFANLLKTAGYATAMVGKWQLGHDPQQPKDYGFDEYCLWQHTRRPPRYANPGLEINGVEKDYSHGEYGPDLVNHYALDFIARHKGQPFFIYYPMILTHSPYQPTPDSKTWDPKAVGENVHKRPEHFADMVAYMDKLVGKVVARLDELNLRDNTLIFFLGDNGTGKGTPSKMGDVTVVGGKGETTRFGTHVPLIARWPASGASGKICDDLIDSTDFLPTVCQAAGVSIPASLAIDGRSFLPQVKGQPGDPRPWIYHWYNPRGERLIEFAHDLRFKLYADGRLFDLAADPNEKQPLDPAGSTADATAARAKLQGAIDSFKNARPDHLKKPADASATPDEKKKKKNKKK
jgi:arylsulfatase A